MSLAEQAGLSRQLGGITGPDGKKIPELAKGLGEGIRNFKDSLKGDASATTPDDKKQA